MHLLLYTYREMYLIFNKPMSDFNDGFLLMWNHNYNSMCEPGYFYESNNIKL